MSDTVRTFSGEAGAMRRRRRGGGGCFWRALIVLIVAGIAASFWITRDSYSVRRFVPSRQAYHIVLADPAQNRDRIAASPIWEALPDSLGLSPLRTLVTETMGYPEWVFNNFVRERLHATGPEVTQFDDTIFLTRMSRLGRLLEPVSRWMPAIDYDHAGGLGLRHVTDPGFFYAVRGRVLIMSRSRDALIQSLTIAEDRVIAEDEYATLTQSGGEDIRGFVLMQEAAPGDSLFAHVGFALRIDGAGVHAKFQTRYSDYWRQRLRPMMQGLQPQPLSMPIDGPAMIAMDLQRPFQEVWTGLGEAFHLDLMSEEQWEAWAERPLFESPGLPYIATGMLAESGPGIRLSVQGIDVREIFPVPEMVLTIDADPATVREAMGAIPAPPPSVQPWDPYPRYNADTGMVSVPLFGGPAIEPTAFVMGGHLVVSSSRPLAERVVSQIPGEGAIEQEGNIFIRLVPADCAVALVEAGRQFAAIDALRGMNEAEFEVAAGEWLDASARVSEITLLAVLNETGATADLRIVCPAKANETAGTP